MTQRTLDFDAQPRELSRVTGRIGELIVEFIEQRLRTQPEFHAADLHKFVAAHETVAPDSPIRVMRDMKQQGQINYTLLSRRGSLYRAERNRTLVQRADGSLAVAASLGEAEET